MKYKEMPDCDTLRRILDYDPETGAFVWRHRTDMPRIWNHKCAGKAAGAAGPKGGISIFVNNVAYYAHRLAWVYVHGAIPLSMQVDHKNCDNSDNRISNLRLATHGQNSSNSRRRSTNSLPKGVAKQKNGKSFKAQIGINKKIIYLGTFQTPEEAHAAYCAAAVAFKGEFARAG